MNFVVFLAEGWMRIPCRISPPIHPHTQKRGVKTDRKPIWLDMHRLAIDLSPLQSAFSGCRSIAALHGQRSRPFGSLTGRTPK